MKRGKKIGLFHLFDPWCKNILYNDIWAFQYFDSSQYLTDIYFLVQLKRWIRVKLSWMKVFLLERHPKFPPVSSFQDNAPMTSQRNHLLFNSTEFMKRDLFSLSMIPPPIPGKERGGSKKGWWENFGNAGSNSHEKKNTAQSFPNLKIRIPQEECCLKISSFFVGDFVF